MPRDKSVPTSNVLQDVKYEIRGDLAHRAQELERQGYEILSLNIGNPGLFGFRTPETMRLAMIENLGNSEAYCHQQGVFPAREAVVMQQQDRGVMDVSADQVFIGNGVSELIDLTLRALLNPGDEVLIPSPDYPLWTAATALNGGKPVHYPCPPASGFQPNVEEMTRLVTDRTKAVVVINPNNPTGAVYSQETLEGIARLAERRGLVVFSDEIYDHMVYEDNTFVPMATLVKETLCATLSGLSKVYRACGYRVGWASFSGATEPAQEYFHALELLASLRLCSNVPGQWAVQTALGGYQSIKKLCQPGGRLFESRRTIQEGVANSPFLELDLMPQGSMYAFIRVNERAGTDFDDQRFALDLLESAHVLVAPGSSFNVPYRNCFRITTLPDPDTLKDVFARIDGLLGKRVRESKLESVS